MENRLLNRLDRSSIYLLAGYYALSFSKVKELMQLAANNIEWSDILEVGGPTKVPNVNPFDLIRYNLEANPRISFVMAVGKNGQIETSNILQKVLPIGTNVQIGKGVWRVIFERQSIFHRSKYK